MPKRIYITNLSTSITSRDLQKLLSKYGDVGEIKIARDGTASVEMKSGGDEAIKSLHQTDMGGRLLNIKGG